MHSEKIIPIYTKYLVSPEVLIVRIHPSSENYLQHYSQTHEKHSNNLIPVDSTHPFENQRQQDFSTVLLQATGLPLTKVSELAYRPNDYRTHGVLGTTEKGGFHDGRLTFYKDMNKVPAIGQLGVAVHELSHSVSPFDPWNTQEYGSEKNRLHALDNVYKIAHQTETTGVFFNEYHKMLYQLLQQGQISYNHWLEENHAISLELAATNPNHLAQVELAQYISLYLQGRQREFTRLTSRTNPRTQEEIVSGLDRTLMNLTKLPTANALKNHWETLRNTLKDTITPLHDPRALTRRSTFVY